MSSRFLSDFHSLARNVDYRIPLEALLHEFRQERFADAGRAIEESAMVNHFGELWSKWDSLFTDFPETLWKRRTAMWEYARGRRDEYLLKLIVRHVPDDRSRDPLIVNPATVFGRHGISISSVLQHEPPGAEDQCQTVPVVITTHTGLEGDIRNALAEVDALDTIQAGSVCIAIVDEHPEKL